MPGFPGNDCFGARQCIGYIINYEKRFCQLNIGLLMGPETGFGPPAGLSRYCIGKKGNFFSLVQPDSGTKRSSKGTEILKLLLAATVNQASRDADFFPAAFFSHCFIFCLFFLLV
jgi:hypothetical protein